MPSVLKRLQPLYNFLNLFSITKIKIEKRSIFKCKLICNNNKPSHNIPFSVW